MPAPTALDLASYRTQLKQFVDFTDEQWQEFTTHLYKKSYKKKELFISGDKICQDVGFILQGSFRMYFVKDGVEISNYFCFRNELISSYRSFLKQAPSQIFIEAMEDSALICFTHQSLQKMLADERMAFAMEHFGRTIAEYLICCYEERVLSFITQTPEERYLNLLRHQPDFLQRVPQHYLANYLGVTPVSLSRIRKRIQETNAREKLAS